MIFLGGGLSLQLCDFFLDLYYFKPLKDSYFRLSPVYHKAYFPFVISFMILWELFLTKPFK